MGLSTCTMCGFQANMKPMLDHHMLSVHNQNVIQETTLGLKCEDSDVKDMPNEERSGYITDTKNKLKPPGFTSTKHLSCQLCDYECQYSKELFTHEKN